MEMINTTNILGLHAVSLECNGIKPAIVAATAVQM
jgi:hypothetical protein